MNRPSPSGRFRRLAADLRVPVVVATLVTVAMWAGMFGGLQASTTDVFFRRWGGSGVREVAQSVVLVAIDDDTIRQLGRVGEWPRGYYAQVIDRLTEANARGIVFDVLFSEPSEDDPLLISSLKRFTEPPTESPRLSLTPPPRRIVVMPLLPRPSTAARYQRGAPTRFPDALRPLPAFAGASTGIGHAITPSDPDWVVRRSPVVVEVLTEQVPSLALAAADAYTGAAPGSYRVRPDGLGIEGATRHIPTDEHLNMLASFLGPPSHANDPGHSPFRVVSFADVLNGKINTALLRDKMVFIGALDAGGLTDEFQVPTSGGEGRMAGVEIHATAFATIVSGRIFTQAGFGVTVATVWALCLLTGLAASRLGIYRAALGTVALGLVYVGIALMLPDAVRASGGVAIPDLVYPLMALGLTFLCACIARVARLERELRATPATRWLASR